MLTCHIWYICLGGPFFIPFLSDLQIATIGIATADILWSVENAFGWMAKDMAKPAKTDATTRQQMRRDILKAHALDQ